MSDATRITLGTDLNGREALTHAENALASGDDALAERYFLRALRVALDFEKSAVRARYVHHLVGHGQVARALSLTEGWIRDEHGIWLDDILIPLAVMDPNGAKACLKRLRLERYVHAWHLMSLSQEYSNKGHSRIAIILLKRLIRWCDLHGEREDAWRAMGQLGRVYEDAGMGRKAEAVWSQAFREGSANRVLARRYTQYLERKRRYEECLHVVTEAIKRIRDPELLTILERRKQRLLRKTAPPAGKFLARARHTGLTDE